MPRTSTPRLEGTQCADPASEPKDSSEIGASCSQVSGNIGTLAGVVVGRPLVVAAGAVVAGAVAGSVFGPIGTLVGGALGAYGGYKLEVKTKLGRLLGGLTGGAIGSAVGKVGDWLGAKPNETLKKECSGFSVSSLPHKLLNVSYTSHHVLGKEVAAEAAAVAQPGDLIITNDEIDFKFELGQKAGGLLSRACEALGLVPEGSGIRANWTHLYTVDKGEKVIDILLNHDGGGPNHFDVQYPFMDNMHAKILRPAFTSEETKNNFLDWMNAQFGKVGYDLKFDLKSDDKLYCQEYAYKGLKATDPNLEIQPTYVGIGKWKRGFITADSFDQDPRFKEVWNSGGSNFWVNWMSKFN